MVGAVTRRKESRRDPAASIGAALSRIGGWCFVRPLGLTEQPGRDCFFTVVVVAAVAASRWLAFPASIWDRDEAIFAQALVDFAPQANVPHPPFFPLWVGLGRLMHTLLPGVEPESILQGLSAVFSVWTLFPLAALASLVMSRRHATVSALLYLAVPAVWLFAGRAFSGTMATALLIAAAAHLLNPDPSPGSAAAGAGYLAACLLTRPQLLPVAIALCVWHTTRASTFRTRILPWLLPLMVGLPVATYFVLRCGGAAATLSLIRNHAVYHFGKYGSSTWSVGDLGVLNAAGGTLQGLVWLALAVEGFVVLFRSARRRPAALGMLAAAAFPAIYYAVFAHNATFIRYALPWYALTAPAVVVAVTAMLGSGRKGAIGLAVLIALVSSQVVPSLGSYRSRPAPIVGALDEISGLDAQGDIHLLVDHNLATYVDLYETMGRIRCAVSWMPRHPEPFEERTFTTDRVLAVAIFDDALRRWEVSGGTTSIHECPDQWLCSMASPRFHRVVVVYGIDPS